MKKLILVAMICFAGSLFALNAVSFAQDAAVAGIIATEGDAGLSAAVGEAGMPSAINEAKENTVATIVSAEGNVTISSESGQSVAVKKGMILGEGTKIVTGAGSYIEIAFGNIKNSNVVKLEENSTAVIQSGELIKLDKGKVFVLLSNLEAGKKFEVRTPTSVSGARGTGWSVAAKELMDDVAVYLNKIYVQSFDEDGKVLDEKEIESGNKTTVKQYKKIGELVQIPKEDTEKWTDWVFGVKARVSALKPVAEPYQEPGAGAGDFDIGGGASEEGREENAEGTPPSGTGSSSIEEPQIGIGGVNIPDDEPEFGVGGVNTWAESAPKDIIDWWTGLGYGWPPNENVDYPEGALAKLNEAAKRGGWEIPFSGSSDEDSGSITVIHVDGEETEEVPVEIGAGGVNTSPAIGVNDTPDRLIDLSDTEDMSQYQDIGEEGEGQEVAYLTEAREMAEEARETIENVAQIVEETKEIEKNREAIAEVISAQEDQYLLKARR